MFFLYLSSSPSYATQFYTSLHLISRSVDLQPPIMLRISLLQLLFVTLLGLSAVFAADAVQGTSQRESPQEIADINAASLHGALHALSAKFRHGIFPTDLDAAEALQGEEPTIASLIKLAKRQDNATASSAAPVPTVTTAPEPTSEPATSSAVETSETSSESSVEPTTSAQPTETSASSTSETSASSTSSASVPTETSSTVSTQTTPQPTTATTTSSTAQTTKSETTSVPSTLSTTKSTSSTSTSTTTHKTTTSARTTEHTSLTTSTSKSTTTMPDGSQSTITSITVITPEATGSPSGTAAGKPGLQTNAAALPTGMAREIVAMVGGAVVVAMAL